MFHVLAQLYAADAINTAKPCRAACDIQFSLN